MFPFSRHCCRKALAQVKLLRTRLRWFSQVEEPPLVVLRGGDVLVEAVVCLMSSSSSAGKVKRATSHLIRWKASQIADKMGLHILYLVSAQYSPKTTGVAGQKAKERWKQQQAEEICKHDEQANN